MKNRTEGCTEEAMTDAAESGHLEVVKWLYQNCKFDAMAAMSAAAEENHFNIIAWLYYADNKSELANKNV